MERGRSRGTLTDSVDYTRGITKEGSPRDFAQSRGLPDTSGICGGLSSRQDGVIPLQIPSQLRFRDQTAGTSLARALAKPVMHQQLANHANLDRQTFQFPDLTGLNWPRSTAALFHASTVALKQTISKN